jgi:hypothetical protein
LRSRRYRTADDVIDDDDDRHTQTGGSVGGSVGGGLIVSRLSQFSEFVLSAFLLVWFVCGNCWVFVVRRPIHFRQPPLSPNNWCDRTVYVFAFIQIVASYAIAGLVAVGICLLAVCHRSWSVLSAVRS